MAHSICLIDDKIPLGDEKLFIDDTGRLNSSNIELLLNEEGDKWEEPVRELITNLISDKDSWSVSAFRYPDIYLNNFDKESYFPDFIIFDWDYGKMTESTEELLKKILQKSFVLISIYTQSDEKETVERIIDGELQEYRNRINLIIKSEENSPQKLIDWAKDLTEKNFASKFSKELRAFNRDSLESLLVEFGKPNIEDVIYLFGNKDKERNKIVLNTKDISAIIADKLRDELVTRNFGEELPLLQLDYKPTCGDLIINKMWSLRLYYRPQDNTVRKGDIIAKEGEENIKYLVISSDCNLNAFWKKNIGYLTLLPMYKVHKNNTNLITKLKLASAEKEIKNINATSLVNLSPGIGDGPIIVPCIPKDTGYENYFLFPKEIMSINIPWPESKKESPKIVSLDYSYISNFIGVNRIALSEPFITPLVEHILYNISGYGVQDFPEGLQKSINNKIKEMF